FFKA
uniref:Antho-KAamide n=1 Tax=Anthopleura elegantissima TaxID=6110 RepID=FFKA_ANTEL